LLTPMMGTATKRAAKIPPAGIARMREKANRTVATAHRTVCQVEPIAQGGIDCVLVLTNKRTSAIELVPISPKRKDFGDRDDKNAKFSVRMWRVLCMTSSYKLDAQASRRGTRFFHAPSQDRARTIAQNSNRNAAPKTRNVPSTSPARHFQRPLLGKKKSTRLFLEIDSPLPLPRSGAI
jgi:hypothetical protein